MSKLIINLFILCVIFPTTFAEPGDDFDFDIYEDVPEAGPENVAGTENETENVAKDKPTMLQEEVSEIADNPAKMDCYCKGSLDMIETVKSFRSDFLEKNVRFKSQETFELTAAAVQNKLKEISEELCSGLGKSSLEEFIEFYFEMVTTFQMSMIEKFLRLEYIRKIMYKFYNEIFTCKANMLKCTFDVDWQ